MEMQTKFSNLKDAVGEYQALGWRVMPVKTFVDIRGTVAKQPLVKDWTNPATVFDFTIKHNAIGIITGANSNATLLDVDNKNGVNGFLTLKRLGIVLPDTVCALTPTGGKHYVYQYCPDVHTGAAVLGEGSGIDIRNDGGFIVAAPSEYPFSPNYQWLEGQAPGEIEIAEFPKDLLEKIKEYQATGIFPIRKLVVVKEGG